ncbi:hypothetical protein GTA08_BOTSDO08533 [Botryosphaeria dothidea]|uniref:Uncharacterized protein n=1 Tax=Botryosphaeria dothidea TaxID=55169 RepID=A0A8H4IP93_9PEZI|nr:hypothetical protein GTA08_BOTSDO08533 [Botryosphaeria dothidea]
MHRLLNFLTSASAALAAVSVVDPSDFADLTSDASDNAIKAVYDIEPILYQTNDILGPYYYSNGNDTSAGHTSFTVDANDTSVIVVAEGTQLNLSYVDVVKHGYSSNLYQASFYGLNAAINIANDSSAYITHSNITVHNGAANVFAYGANSYVYISDSDLYSSGPVSHGLYAAGNGTIVGKNIRHFSGGNRCSSFSGDNPAGVVNVSDSVAHTAGIGSALFYALGTVKGENVVGLAEKAPSLFSDGPQTAEFEHVDFTAGLLAGTVMFSSQTRTSGAHLSFASSKLTVTASDGPAFWFGNVIATAHITSTNISTVSNILLVANSSQVTQEFSYFAGAEENSAILPAEVEATIEESDLVGDVVVYNGSTVSWSLAEYSVWTGKVVQGEGGDVDGTVSVALDSSSTWVVTGDTVVGNFTNADSSLANLQSAGFTVQYDSSAEGNAWLNGSTYELTGGGSLRPL